MSTQVSKKIYAMLEEAMEKGELDSVVVTFEYGEEKIPARLIVDEMSATKSFNSTLSQQSGFLRNEYQVQIDRIYGLATDFLDESPA